MYIESLDSILKESKSGAKAFHLSKMKRVGLPVPAGFVINVSAFEYFFLNNVNLDEAFKSSLSEALNNIANFRTDEGASLEKEFQLRIAKIRSLMTEAVAYDAERVATVKTRLRTALDELKVAVDENRFEQELIFYLEK